MPNLVKVTAIPKELLYLVQRVDVFGKKGCKHCGGRATVGTRVSPTGIQFGQGKLERQVLLCRCAMVDLDAVQAEFIKDKAKAVS